MHVAQLTCIVVTPEQTVVESTADFVAVPLDDGELGIAPGRAPLIGRLGFGELRIRLGRAVTRYYVDAGFVQVLGNVVSIMTDHALPAEQLNPVAAHEQLDAARTMPIVTAPQEAARDRVESRARGQLHVARRV
jgi:F-type H+-transporting ATPase subunit epsilon